MASKRKNTIQRRKKPLDNAKKVDLLSSVLRLIAALVDLLNR